MEVITCDHPSEYCDGRCNRLSKLTTILARLIHANDLCKRHGEDIIGVLNKCGAFRDCNIVELADEIEKQIILLNI